MPSCLECGLLPDSPSHQVLECVNHPSVHRDALSLLIGKFEYNFHIPIIFNQEDETNPAVIDFHDQHELSLNHCPSLSQMHFKKQVRIICAQSQFGDQLLTY